MVAMEMGDEQSIEEYLQFFKREKVAVQITSYNDKSPTIHMMFGNKLHIVEHVDIMKMLKNAKKKYVDYINSLKESGDLI